eukprot:TRINITY_DN9709_c1_g2_i1.p1 TRINITY_DN9709_c1_g2~~TRINITY_DN9709_c1_g2_i1.p1  ORF type:complete len:500 (-),score=133.82 TRINITY_DN9709_c1_g2_i1:217-1716(-)
MPSLIRATCLCILLVAVQGDPSSRLFEKLKSAAGSDDLSGWTFSAGVAEVDATLPIGVPLAGYNYPPRRTNVWPIPDFKEYTTFMGPSVGVLEPTYVRALVMTASNGVVSTGVALLTMDVIGADSSIADLAYAYAVTQGFSIPFANCIFSASHSHSGPGAISPEWLWSVAPSSDVMVPKLQRQFAQSIAAALVQAQANLKPAKIGIGSGEMYGVTHNRRTNESPYVNYTTIDPMVGVIRIDDLQDNPVAVVWNFAIHGICYDAPNMMFSSDNMGAANHYIEGKLPGAVSMFVNADAGDINPVFSVVCQNPGKPYSLSGGPVMGDYVLNVRANLTTYTSAQIQSASVSVDFGPTQANFTLSRLANCTQGGPLDLCTICRVLQCDANIHMPAGWIEDVPRFTAWQFLLPDGVKNLFVTIPGEAIVELGTDIRTDTKALGFDRTFLFGYSNNYMGYFTTPREYLCGGYESVLTLWGIGTSARIQAGCHSAAVAVLNQAAGKQ